MIVITHEMSVIEAICDRVAIIDQSHIAEVGKVSDIFSNPKTPIGRQLILGDAAKKVALGTERQLRIIFDGRESSEPVISNLVLACKVPINIMHAETKDVGGKAMGHMLIQIPEDETEANRVINYLKTVKVACDNLGNVKNGHLGNAVYDLCLFGDFLPYRYTVRNLFSGCRCRRNPAHAGASEDAGRGH